MDKDIKEEIIEKISKEISISVVNFYHDKMTDYLSSEKDYTLLQTDVTLMIMNIALSICTNVYFTLKDFNPDCKMDFDFMRASFINILSKNLEGIKKYEPKESLYRLSTDEIKEIINNGFCIIKFEDGSERRVEKEDLLIKQSELEEVMKQEKLNKNSEKKSTKIISPEKKIFIKPQPN